MMTVVLDTSVAIAWYLPEEFSTAARVWRRKVMQGQAECLVPALHFQEFGNVLRKYVLFRELSRSDAEELYTLHCDCPLTIVEPDRRQVLACALDYAATVYDAVYIQLSREYSVPLLTAERTTTSWVQKLGDSVISCR